MVKPTRLEKARAEIIKQLKEDEKTIKRLYRNSQDPQVHMALDILFGIVVASRHGVENHGGDILV
jgi:hypothetical protein